ncbi:Microbial collagenase [Pandoraea terrae]|uniref:microbial collagenase n=1 Tax=Pandoraea terrae TaxID=1537710 RepID=A0A5E4VPI3_9BURK|nr:collagenase [Pandoraea terrae]VVE12915.1 Microbial collagenase [Pandoraea terrae]
MSEMTKYTGSALADYIENLPNQECHDGLFSIDRVLAGAVFSGDNLHAVASRFVQAIYEYDATNLKLINLIIYLRAAYQVYERENLENPYPMLHVWLRPYIEQSLEGDALFKENPLASSTAGGLMRLITDMEDEAHYLSRLKEVIERHTASENNPEAARALLTPSAASWFTGLLTVFYYAHERPGNRHLLENDQSLLETLNRFVVKNRESLSGTSAAHQLANVAREAYRFLQYPKQRAQVKPMVQQMLATTDIDGPDKRLWEVAVEAVEYHDAQNCGDYGLCDHRKNQAANRKNLAAKIMKSKYACNEKIRIVAQDFTRKQMRKICAVVAKTENQFHRMMKTQRNPVPDDYTDSVEIVVFNDMESYKAYGSVIYDINTNNGGLYFEGNPEERGNQARLFVVAKSWLKPRFEIHGLRHEFVHYLDGRYNRAGDSGVSRAKPTIWWVEGIAEYFDHKNVNPVAIRAAKTNTYRLSDIFQTGYSSSDRYTRAYLWGYMATRFLFERHPEIVDSILSRFRAGNYDGYAEYLTSIGNRYDQEFIEWVRDTDPTGKRARSDSQ